MSATTTVSGSRFTPTIDPLTYRARLRAGPSAIPLVPFTRGTRTTGYQAKKWTVRQVMGLGTGEETNERLATCSARTDGHQLDGLGYAPFESSDPKAAAWSAAAASGWTRLRHEDVFREIPIEAVDQSDRQLDPRVRDDRRRRAPARHPAREALRARSRYVLPWGEPPRYDGQH